MGMFSGSTPAASGAGASSTAGASAATTAAGATGVANTSNLTPQQQQMIMAMFNAMQSMGKQSGGAVPSSMTSSQPVKTTQDGEYFSSQRRQ